jgi:hypothetical protein
MLYALLALVAAVLAGFSFYKYTSGTGETMWIILFLIGAAATVGLGGMFLAGRMAKKEEIHITE